MIANYCKKKKKTLAKRALKNIHLCDWVICLEVTSGEKSLLWQPDQHWGSGCIVQPKKEYKSWASDKTCFNLCPFSLVLSVGWEESSSLSLTPFCQIFAHTLLRLLQTKESHLFQPLLVRIPSPSLSACARIAPGSPYLTCTWGGQDWTQHSRYVSPVPTKVFYAAQNTDGWFRCKGVLLACGQLVGHQGCQCPSLQSCFPPTGLPACTGAWGHSSPGCRILYFPLLNLMRFLSAQFSCLICSTSIWYITHSSELCIICNSAELLSAPSSRPLMEILSRTGIDSWGAPLVTCLQLDFVPLTTTLCIGPALQDLAVHFLCPYHVSLPTRVSCDIIWMRRWAKVSRIIAENEQI